MSSRIEQLIDEIEEYIDNCKYQPLSNTKIIVNKEEIDELVVLDIKDAEYFESQGAPNQHGGTQ